MEPPASGWGAGGFMHDNRVKCRNMDYSDKWIQLHKAEDEFFTCRYDFMQDEEEMISNLRKALTNAGMGGNSETALRLLRDMRPELAIIKPLLSGIMDVAIDSTHLTEIGLARDVMYNYKDELWIRENIQTIVMSYLTKNDEWHYQRIAEVYNLLEYREELANFLELCQVNYNWEIQEICKYFPRS